MKNLFKLTLATLLVGGLASCATAPEEQVAPVKIGGEEFTATLAEETRTELGENNAVLWSENDAISLFNASTLNQKYVLKEGVGTTTGTFAFSSYCQNGNIAANTGVYAVYAYADATTIAGNVATVTIPAEQNYTVGEPLLTNAVMVAEGNASTKELPFKNAEGILRLKVSAALPASYTLTKVELVSAANALAGEGTVTIGEGENTLVLAEGGSQTLTVNVTDGELGTDAVSVYVPVPATAFAAGDLTLKFHTSYFGQAGVSEVNVKAAFELKRNKIITLTYVVNPDEWTATTENYEQVTSAAELALAAELGGTVTLANDITLTEPLVVEKNLIINLGDYTISNATGYGIENTGDLTINGGEEGGISGLGGIRSKAGKVTINGGVYTVSSKYQEKNYQHLLKAENTEVVINGGTFDATVYGQTNAMLNASTNATITINGGDFKNVSGDLTDYDPYICTYEKNGKVIINDGTFYGGWRFNGETATTEIYGGNFSLTTDGQSFHANSTHVLTVYGGNFTFGKEATKTAVLGCIAEGYKAFESNGVYNVVAAVTYVDDVDLVSKLNIAHTQISYISTSTGSDLLPIVAVMPEITGYSIYDGDTKITNAVYFLFSDVKKEIISETSYKVSLNLAIKDDEGKDLVLKAGMPSTINGKEYLHVYMNLIEVPTDYAISDVKVANSSLTKTTNSYPATGEYMLGYETKDLYFQSSTAGLIEVTLTKSN